MTRFQNPAAILVALAVAVLPTAVAAQTPSVDEIVAANYPLTRLQPEDALARRSCHKVLTTSGGAPVRIAAGYTDTIEAVFRVLERDPSGSFTVIYESPSTLATMGLACELSLADLDGDSVDDVVFKAIAPRGSAWWLFRAGASGIENITPMSAGPGKQASALISPGLVDLYHDGTLQVVTAGGDPDVPGGRVLDLPTIYKGATTGGVVLDADVLFVDAFKASDPPVLRKAKFALHVDGTGPYVIRLTNGIRGGQRRASTVSIRINGIVVSGTAAMTDQVEFVEVPILMDLLDQNAMEVTVGGAADAEVTVVVRKQP